MVFYNFITSQGQKFKLDINIYDTVDNINQYIFSMVENSTFINSFDLILKNENNILQSDKLFVEYNIPVESKLSFIIKKRGIDIPSPSIYDSPLSSNHSLTKSIGSNFNNTDTNILFNKIISEFNTINNYINDIKEEITDIKQDICFIKKDINRFVKDDNDPINQMD